MKITNFAIATLLFAAGSVFAENLFQGDTGAEAGVEFVTQGGMFKTRVPVFHDTDVFYKNNILGIVPRCVCCHGHPQGIKVVYHKTK